MGGEKDGGGKEESKGKSCCAPPETGVDSTVGNFADLYREP